MARPAAKPALAKAPHKEHPAAPPTDAASTAATVRTKIPAAAGPLPVTAPEPPELTMYSARIATDLAIDAKTYAIRTRSNLQKLTEAALTEYMRNHPNT